jgi:uncharacterized protein (TIGR00297 family)
VGRANSRLQTGLFVTMQVPPLVPSLLHPKRSLRGNNNLSAFLRSRNTGPWFIFAIILLGVLVALMRRPELRHNIVPALLVTFAFAAIARSIGGITTSGAAAGFLVTCVLFIAGGRAMFGTVLLVFVLTYLATRFGRRRKRQLAIAERATGRDGAQVLANVGLAALAAALSCLTPWRAHLLTGSIAALAEAACDTVSSETGKALAQNARVITSWIKVPAGADGAISLPGTLLGIAATVLVGWEVVATKLLDVRLAVIAVIAGALGMLFDSLLGATLERRGWLTNNAVNLISTAFAVLLAALLAM